METNRMSAVSNAITKLQQSPKSNDCKEMFDLNNNLIFIPEYSTSTPLAGTLRSHLRRHRPDGESPEKPERLDSITNSPLNVSEEKDESEKSPPNAVQHQKALNAYYTDLMWQSYYSQLASLMTQSQNPMLPFRLNPGQSQIRELLAQQQQQMTLLKWSSQVAAAMQNQQRNSEVKPSSTSSSAPSASAGSTPAELGGMPGFRAEPRRTRIDMDEFKAELSAMTELYRACMTLGDSNIERAASTYRTAATSSRSHTVHWEGNLQVSHPLSVTYSRKVFIGGVPWDIRDHELELTLRDFGRFELLWPQSRERRNSMHRGGQLVPRGYCYLVFDDERQVKGLLQRCVPRDGATFIRLGNRSSDKEAQVIPWCVADASFAARGLHSTNAKTTVFVGALHGMITASNLATIMSDTFGDVICAALDTDRYKYPIGSGRVVFATSESYKKAVEANFLQVKTSKFVKTIQIDPYLEDSMCSVCFYAPGVYFCRSTKCFQYYCPPCWQSMHANGDEERGNHKPLRRTFRNPIDRKFM